MKKFLSILLALTLTVSMAALFTACGDKAEEPEVTEATTEAAEEDTTAEEETTADASLPKAGDTVKVGAVSVTIPEGWQTATYNEGQNIELENPDIFMSSAEITLHNVYGDEHAKEWADNINENYGGDKEIDKVTIAGKEFYRVKADPEQNVCFTDLDDKTYVEISVMFLPWEDGAAVLDAITID